MTAGAAQTLTIPTHTGHTQVGAAKLSGDTINYLGIEGLRVAGKQGIGVIAACQLVLMGGPEYARSVGIKGLEPVGIFLPGDANYPGGAPGLLPSPRLLRRSLRCVVHAAAPVLRHIYLKECCSEKCVRCVFVPPRRRAVRPVWIRRKRGGAGGAEGKQSRRHACFA